MLTRRAQPRLANNLAIRSPQGERSGPQAGERNSKILAHGTARSLPEHLVGFGFRHWMLGHQTSDLGCWEQAWSLYVTELGVERADAAIRGLSSWVRILGQTSCRRIDVGEPCDKAFCRDECLAVSMIAACQHQTCPALRACIFALIETNAVDRVASEAQAFADTMFDYELVLSPASIVSPLTTVAPVNSLQN